MNEEPLDFSWATYRDPDKVEDYLVTVTNPVKVENKPKAGSAVPKTVNKNVVIKKKKSKFSLRVASIITGISMTTASLLVINMIGAKAKKLSASEDSKEEAKNVISSALPIESSDIYVEPQVTDDSSININDEETFTNVEPIKEDITVNTYVEEKDYKYEEINKEDHSDLDENTSYSDVCIDVPLKAQNYLTDDVYNMVIDNFGEYISKYSKMYGVDPNVVAGLIMVESPDYDINNDYDYHKIGLGQYKGEYFDNETFKTFNYVTNQMESYTVHVENLYANPEEQIKMICITMATSAKDYNYNLVATLEHHNKGCGSVSTSLESIMNEKGYQSKKDVLKYEDQNEIIKHMPELGDPRYSYKIAYCANRCLENKVFGETDKLVFKDYNNNTDHIINFSINTMQRS